jgi:hypothetical protein
VKCPQTLEIAALICLFVNLALALVVLKMGNI